MSKLARVLLFAIVGLVLLVVIAVVAIPAFLNTDSFRTRIEASLSKSLGRHVTIGKLNLSLLSGGMIAENTVVSDDPRFSAEPFIQTDSVKIHVEVLPLLLHRQVHILGFALQSPKVQLIRAANGTWNYSSIGGAAAASKQDAETRQTSPDLTVGHITIENGRITVATQAAPGSATAAPSRIYEQVNLDVKDFGLTNSFPFTVSAHLPAEGTIEASGSVGPLNQEDAAATPFSGHLELKHIDPLAAGFVDSSAGVSGLIDSLVIDAVWSGQQLHVSKIVATNPHLTILSSNVPKSPKPVTTNKPEGSSMLDGISVDSAEVHNGTVTLTTVGKSGPPAVYQQLNAQITNLTPKNASPFTVSAQLPGGGSLAANGKAGPFNQDNNAATPVNAQVTLKHVELETSGVLSPDAGISGMADLQAEIQSNGQALNASGTAHVDGIKLARNGHPSPKPVDVQFAIVQNEQAKSGQIQHATITIGRAVFTLAGTYGSRGLSTDLDLHVGGRAVPIDEIEAFLPAAGVRLPQNSRLQGGTVTTDLAITGTTANPTISGPVSLAGTQLAGFDLGAKLQSLSRLTGGRIGNATGSGTNIRSLSMNIREAGGGIRTDKIALDLTGVGTATGSGSVSEAGALDYSMLLKLTGLINGPAAGAASTPAASPTSAAGLMGLAAGLIPGGTGSSVAGLGSLSGIASGVLRSGIPVEIGGTTSNPTFAPNLRGLAGGIGASAAQGLISKKGLPASTNNKVDPQQLRKSLGNLFGKH